MSAAIAEKPAEFVSRRKGLTLTIKPERRRLSVETGEAERVPGRRLQFVDGHLQTSDPSELTFLRGHRLFGNGVTGFMELEPPVPEPVEELKAIQAALTEADAETIERLLVAEREGHNRTIVIELGQSALETLNSPPTT